MKIIGGFKLSDDFEYERVKCKVTPNFIKGSHQNPQFMKSIELNDFELKSSANRNYYRNTSTCFSFNFIFHVCRFGFTISISCNTSSICKQQNVKHFHWFYSPFGLFSSQCCEYFIWNPQRVTKLSIVHTERIVISMRLGYESDILWKNEGNHCNESTFPASTDCDAFHKIEKNK